MASLEKNRSKEYILRMNTKDRMPRYSYYFSNSSNIISSMRSSLSVDDEKTRSVSPNFGIPGLYDTKYQRNIESESHDKTHINISYTSNHSNFETYSNDQGEDMIGGLDREDELRHTTIPDEENNTKSNIGTNNLEIDPSSTHRYKIDRWCKRYANGNMETFRNIQREKMFDNEQNMNYNNGYNLESLDELNIRVIYNKGQIASLGKFDPSVLKTGDIIINRYLIEFVLSSSTFSTVVRAIDQTSNVKVSIKISISEYITQAIDEIILLKYLNSKGSDGINYIVNLLDYFFYKGCIFMVTELLGSNLYEINNINSLNQINLPSNPTSKANSINRKGGWSLDEIRSVAHDILRALNHLHDSGIINCDLKPENILIRPLNALEKNTINVKMIDLGSSCFIQDKLNTYVQSRSYRAPEVVFGLPYDTQIDIWSLGCTLCEIYMKRILFPSDNNASLIASMISLLGVPPLYMLQYKMNKAFIVLPSGDVVDFDAPKHLLNSVPNHKNIDTLLPTSISETYLLKGSNTTSKDVENNGSDLHSVIGKGPRWSHFDADYNQTLGTNIADSNSTHLFTNNYTRIYENNSTNSDVRQQKPVKYDCDCNKIGRDHAEKHMRIIRPFVTSIDMMLELDKSEDIVVFIDFIRGLLQYDPIDRMTAKEALLHPFITKIKR
ncbi:protein kinase domain-containing protein [Theileria equi strain WA]|uniref:Protein kinase domain-containing protein n=1 Tax=Theileria equi strain WA TaxID=1537102 RepID=L0B3N4_THEEQ|nr:protein kinase domain-containing protein [Theileria equi strain WA]AFZ81719.1 protein kinase domain-containing protein [Theileria equi strain WA]|eukprot:XP_004831385.1 protein kinase domain-containing protein [Theileria equi strain WA]